MVRRIDSILQRVHGNNDQNPTLFETKLLTPSGRVLRKPLFRVNGFMKLCSGSVL
jgi:hypothetical protein